MSHYDKQREEREDKLDADHIKRYGLSIQEASELRLLSKEVAAYVSIEDKRKRLEELKKKSNDHILQR